MGSGESRVRLIAQTVLALTEPRVVQGFDDWYPEQAAAKLAAGGYRLRT